MTIESSVPSNCIRVGMVGLGMIFDETYAPVFEQLDRRGLWSPSFGPVAVQLVALASRTGFRGQAFLHRLVDRYGPVRNCHGDRAMEDLLQAGVDAVCVATPDDRHFECARLALEAGKHILIEKPSVLRLQELDHLQKLAEKNNVLARVVYHKLADPDHKKLRSLYAAGTLRHVNNGYCDLLEPRQISGQQFAEWIQGRNPGTYVAVHYVKLIDFTFSRAVESRPLWKLRRISATGQRGIVGPPTGSTWDSVQLQMTYQYDDAREAAFDIHTNWVTPDNFTGYVDQEVQFRFDNAIWLAHQRKRGVEMAIDGVTPHQLKNTPNHHYNASFLEPWNEVRQRGYGLEVLERFFGEVADVEFGGPCELRLQRLNKVRQMEYADLSADRNTVAVVQAMEAILQEHAQGNPGCQVVVNSEQGGLVLLEPGSSRHRVLYSNVV